MNTVIHLGCGNESVPEDRFPKSEWREVRVDLDPETNPDVVADICEVPLPDGSGDAVFCSHVLEHVREVNLPKALMEFRRLLRADGELIVAVPDIQLAAQWVAENRGSEVMYRIKQGDEIFPIRPLDLIYGCAFMLNNHPLMTHLTGFTAGTLGWWLAKAGFVGKVSRTDKTLGYSLVAEVRKNGHTPELAVREQDKNVILIQGEIMEKHPDDQLDPQPNPEEQEQEKESSEAPAGPSSGAIIATEAIVEIQDPE